MILETKVAAALSMTGLLIAQAEIAIFKEWAGLGISVVLCFILFWIIAKRDPEIARNNNETAIKTAEIHAGASRDVAAVLRDAISEQTKQINTQHQHTHELLARALACDLPRK